MAGSDERISLRLPPRNGALDQMLNWWTNSNAIPLPQGQHTSNGAEEKIPDIGHMQAKRTAPTGGQSAQEKRFRGANWEDEEKAYLLVRKLRFLVLCVLQSQGLSTSPFKYGKSWSHYVSEQLGRAATSCQGQWDSLLKSRNAIYDHESKINSGTIRHVSFWKMSEHEKHIANEERHKLEQLPRVFPRSWYELMETIFLINAVKKNSCSTKVNPPSPSTVLVASAITDSDDSPPGSSDGAIRSQPSSSHDRSSMDPPLPLVSNQGAKDEVLAMSDDDLFSIIGPFVTKRIADDLKTQVIPLLRSREEDEQKHREKLLAIEAEKLALKRDKLNVKRDKLDVKRQKMLLMISPRGASSMAHVDSACPEAGVAMNVDMTNLASEQQPSACPEAGVAINVDMTNLASEQQPNYIQMPSNEEFSSPDGISSPDFSVLAGWINEFPVGIAREQLED